MVAYAKYYECDPLDSKLALAKDQLLPLLVMDVFNDWEGMPGIFIAGVFSAALRYARRNLLSFKKNIEEIKTQLMH